VWRWCIEMTQWNWAWYGKENEGLFKRISCHNNPNNNNLTIDDHQTFRSWGIETFVGKEGDVCTCNIFKDPTGCCFSLYKGTNICTYYRILIYCRIGIITRLLCVCVLRTRHPPWKGYCVFSWFRFILSLLVCSNILRKPCLSVSRSQCGAN